jgi:ABC-type taurine transport system ATPase subunit
MSGWWPNSPGLFPWSTVGGNIATALKWAKVPKFDRPARAVELLSLVGLDGLGPVRAEKYVRAGRGSRRVAGGRRA